MSRDKQISEMANDLAKICPDLVENCCGQVNCVTHLTLSLSKLGYHKHSDGNFVLFKPRRENRNATYKCSCCAKLFSSYYNDVGEWKWCPNCGAKMKGE